MSPAEIMLTIDGSQGEGGGQILRTSLALSLMTGKPFRILKIRAGRKKPGLMRQHLTAVNAAAEVGRAEVTGTRIGSQEVLFTPKHPTPGEYHFAVGTAGSATLVLQTILPALVTARGPSLLTLSGGTHNPFAPPFDFLVKSFLPLMNRMGPKVHARLERAGFFPAGGGRIEVTIEPAERLTGFELRRRGEMTSRSAKVLLSRLPRHIAQRELKVIEEKLGWPMESMSIEEITTSPGPGNVVLIELGSSEVTEVFTSFGQRGVSAEAVAEQAVRQARRYIDADVPVGEHLADQLLLPLALAGSGVFRTMTPSRHTQTSIEVIHRFLDDVTVCTTRVNASVWQIELRRPDTEPRYAKSAIV